MLVARQSRQRSKAVRQTCAFAMLQIFFVLFITLLPAIAATHPVPLDKNTDAAKCLECHADKSKGKAVHSAMATGCLSCHEIRVNKDVTRVKLITSTPSALCLTCHADKNPAQIKGKVHSPALRDCLKCHDPHTSPNKNQLLKTVSGDKDANLCLTCHNQGENVPDQLRVLGVRRKLRPVHLLARWGDTPSAGADIRTGRC